MSIEIIAEIGVNHNGKIDVALDLIREAAQAGVDTVKFQLWNTHEVYPPERWEQMGRLELAISDLERCKAHCEEYGLKFLCTPDTYHDAILLTELGVDRLKIGSSNVTNIPLLEKVARLGLPVILSTGACSWVELLRAQNAFLFTEAYHGALTMMHCVSAYPAPLEEQNLKIIGRLAEIWRVRPGFSDHTIGHTAALVALGLGARTFEKHMTFSVNACGPDHIASIEPHEMTEYVQKLRGAAAALGNGVKRVMPCEENNRREYDRFVGKQYADSAAAS